MTTKEIKSLVGPAKKLYEVTPSVESDEHGNYVRDVLIIETQNKYFPSKEVTGTVYLKKYSQKETNQTLQTLRKLFGEDISVVAYATSYSMTKCQKEQNRTILLENGDSCVSDFTCNYIVGAQKAVKKFKDEIGNTKICVNKVPDMEFDFL